MGELIRQIEPGVVSLPSISMLLASATQDPAVTEKNAFMHVVQTIAVLSKDAMAFVVQGNAEDAVNSAKRIVGILRAAHEISQVASKEGLDSIPVSQIAQIDVIKGRPTHALK